MRLFKIWLILTLFIPSVAVSAQADPPPTIDPDDNITIAPIAFDTPVQQRITETSIFDRWILVLQEGDRIRITMRGMDGLAPLVGVADTTGSVIASSDTDEEGEFIGDTEPDGVARLEFTAPRSGEYAIVATRAGRFDGTTTGTYSLVVQAIIDPERFLPPVEIRCRDVIAPTALTLEFRGRDAEGAYRMSVYGADGFVPLIRARAGRDGQIEDCSRDPQRTEGSTAIFPDGTTFTLGALDEIDDAAQFALTGGVLLEFVELMIGAEGGETGRFMIVLEGFRLLGAGDSGYLRVRLGPLNIDATLDVYMVRVGNTRVDPIMNRIDSEGTILETCDDAGRRECDHVPPIMGAGVIFDDDRTIIGGRLDAGLRLTPGSVDWQILEFASTNRNAGGEYAVIIVGEFAPD